MEEREFRSALYKKLKSVLPHYKIEEGRNLLYKMIVDYSGKVLPEPPKVKEPKRGDFAFQTDILIGKEIDDYLLPLVVIETKWKGFSTHDVITYSYKALKHKEIFPYLRYGLVIGGWERIQRRYFIHNAGFDFALAIKDVNSEEEIKVLRKIIKEQLKVANKLLEIIEREKEVKYCHSILEIR
jgi:hypothetical protein